MHWRYHSLALNHEFIWANFSECWLLTYPASLLCCCTCSASSSHCCSNDAVLADCVATVSSAGGGKAALRGRLSYSRHSGDVWPRYARVWKNMPSQYIITYLLKKLRAAHAEQDQSRINADHFCSTGCAAWQPLLGLLSLCLVMQSSLYNSFEDLAPVDENDFIWR